MWWLNHPYGYDPLVASTPAVLSNQRLDPISVAGQAQPFRLRELCQGIIFTMRALAIITSLGAFIHETQPPDTPASWRSVDPMWGTHLAYLASVGVTAAADGSTLKFISTYFAVPKKEDVARSIFHGKALSRKCAPPAAYELA